MAYFPMFIELKEKKCIVIGGGAVAARKVQALVDFEGTLTVIAPKICEGIMNISGITRKIRIYNEDDIEGADLVIAATNSREVNHNIYCYCKNKKIPVNVIDAKEECSFLFPSFVKRGPVVVGITTQGSSPLLSIYIRKRVEDIIPKWYAQLADNLSYGRNAVIDQVVDEKDRRYLQKTFLELGLLQSGELRMEQIDELIKTQNK